MQNWKLEYEIIDKNRNAKDTIRRSASFASYKWKREDLVDRKVIVFGVSRTVPATERVELRKFASNTYTIDDTRDMEEFTSEVSSAVSKILGKDVSGYSHVKMDEKGKITLLAGITEYGTRYSEFHFGAGESSIIRMVIQIESLPDNSLVLVEELENGLHPIATFRMVEYLIDIAERKKVQVVFTTHSNDAILPLPSQAIWSAIDGKVFQGKLDIHALRAITSQIDAKLAIFTEDSFSRDWILAMLNTCENIAVDLIEVHAMNGDGTAVRINKYHNLNPSQKFPSICFIDGDSQQNESEIERVYRLPGECPESYIYDKILDKIGEVCGLLAVSLHKRYEEQERIHTVVMKTRLTNRDPHLLYSQIGKALGFIPEAVVKSAFLSIWTQFYAEQVNRILANIGDILPKENGKTCL
jgi:hypothetical protein